jgi:hypothetical protein
METRRRVVCQASFCGWCSVECGECGRVVCLDCESEHLENGCENSEDEDGAKCFRCEGFFNSTSEVGGDWGDNEEWVCDGCLPVCLACGGKLSSVDIDCCGAGRSDGVTPEVGTQAQYLMNSGLDDNDVITTLLEGYSRDDVIDWFNGQQDVDDFEHQLNSE